MYDKENCNCGNNQCCGDCEPWNCVEQAVNDIWATKEDQIEGLVDRAETAAQSSEASAKASAESAAEAKEFRDEAEIAATTAVAAEGIVVGVANDLQNTANILNNAIAGIAVSSWFYTTVAENQTVIPVPADKNAVDVQSIYIEGARQSPFRGFEFDKTAMTITLAEPLPLGLEIEIILGTYNSDNPNDFAHTLATGNGASLVGTSRGITVQQTIDELNRSFQDGGILRSLNDTLLDKSTIPYQEYVWSGDSSTLPKVVPAGSTPATTGGVGIGAWVSVGDAVLRGQISDPDGAEKYPELQIARWRDEGDIRGWSAIAGSDVTTAIQSAIRSRGFAYIPEGQYKADLTSISIDLLKGSGSVNHKGNLINIGADLTSGTLGEKRLASLNFGNGIDTTPIYSGATNTLQGICILEVNGIKKIFISQRTAGSGATEVLRISEWAYTTDGSAIECIQFTPELLIGHGADLSGYVENGQVYLYTGMVATSSRASGKGYTKIAYKGAATTISDCTEYPLFGDPGDTYFLNTLQSATVSISADGKYVLLICTDAVLTGRFLTVYERANVESASNSRRVRPTVGPVRIQRAPGEGGATLQGLSSEGKYIYTLWGTGPSRMLKSIQVYTMDGILIRSIPVAGAANLYTDNDLFGKTAALGVPTSFEPEAIALFDGQLHYFSMDAWKAIGDVVTYNGYNYASITTGDNVGNPPSDRSHWVLTQATANKGAWSASTTYVSGGYVRREKQLYGVKLFDRAGGYRVASAGQMDKSSGIMLDTYAGPDIYYHYHHNNFALSAYREAIGDYINVMTLVNHYQFRLYDGRTGSQYDNVNYSSIAVTKDSSDHSSMTLMSGNASPSEGGWMRLYSNNSASGPGEVRLSTGSDSALGRLMTNGITRVQWAGGSDLYAMSFYGNIRFLTDAAYDFGSSAYRCKDIYLVNNPKVTSDARLKSLRDGGLDDKVLDAWAKVDYEQYAMLDEIYISGEQAQWHFGVIAQKVISAFESEGLDWTDYGVVKHESWESEPAVYDSVLISEPEYNEAGEEIKPAEFESVLVREEVPAGDRYSIVYGEAAILECALNRRERKKLEERILALEKS